MTASGPSSPGPQTLRAFVNEHAVSVPPGATALDAVRAWSADEASAVLSGTRRITDSRGLPVPADVAVTGGAIFRTLVVRQVEAGDSGEPADVPA